MKCGKGHALQLSSCGIGCQLCDRCERRIDTAFTYRCRACDFDLCERCFAAAKQAARARAQELMAETQAAEKAVKAAVPSTTAGERLAAAISAHSPGSWTPPSLSARNRRPSWNQWNSELPGRVMVARPRTPTGRSSTQSPFLGPGTKSPQRQAQPAKPQRRPASKPPSPSPATEAKEAPVPDQNETVMATHVGQVLQGDAVDMDLALQGLPASDRFRLAAAMMVVRQMTNPHAPKVDPRRDNGSDRGSTWAAITSGQGPRYWSDMNS